MKISIRATGTQLMFDDEDCPDSILPSVIGSTAMLGYVIEYTDSS